MKDLKKCPVVSEEELFEIIQYGSQRRHNKDTKLNKGSSRSQLIMQLTIEQKNLKDNSKLSGKLFLVDMTGSENINKAGLKSKVDNKEAMSFN